jgi:glycosyltransferase involved in cell wall biosynthesis
MTAIGVITRTKNRPILLARALDSVLSQTCKDWQLVVVNDGGNPKDVDALISERQKHFKERVRVIHHPESLGMEAASNAGLNALESDYVLIHDDDDTLYPKFMERVLQFLETPPHPSIKGVITHSERVWEQLKGETITEEKVHPYNSWVQHVSLRQMLAENFFAPISFVFDRKACLEVGAFREDLPVLGDWDFNIRFLSKYEIAVVPEVLARYHNRVNKRDDSYDSTVTAQIDKHALYDSMLRNEWLREDIASGRTGKGVIANQVRMLGDLAWELKREKKTKKKWRLFKK